MAGPRACGSARARVPVALSRSSVVIVVVVAFVFVVAVGTLPTPLLALRSSRHQPTVPRAAPATWSRGDPQEKSRGVPVRVRLFRVICRLRVQFGRVSPPTVYMFVLAGARTRCPSCFVLFLPTLFLLCFAWFTLLLALFFQATKGREDTL